MDTELQIRLERRLNGKLAAVMNAAEDVHVDRVDLLDELRRRHHDMGIEEESAQDQAREEVHLKPNVNACRTKHLHRDGRVGEHGSGRAVVCFLAEITIHTHISSEVLVCELSEQHTFVDISLVQPGADLWHE